MPVPPETALARAEQKERKNRVGAASRYNQKELIKVGPLKKC